MDDALQRMKRLLLLQPDNKLLQARIGAHEKRMPDLSCKRCGDVGVTNVHAGRRSQFNCIHCPAGWQKIAKQTGASYDSIKKSFLRQVSRGNHERFLWGWSID